MTQQQTSKNSSAATNAVNWLRKTATHTKLAQLLFHLYYNLRWLPKQIQAVFRGDNLIRIENERGIFFARPLTTTVNQTSPVYQSTVKTWITEAPEGVFIDAGAGAGLFTNTALTHGAATKAFAFEPNPSEYPLLLKHISENDLNAEAVHAALAKSSGMMEMPPNSVHTKSSSVCGGSGVQAPTVSLDGFLKEHDINPADIGAIRVESYGHELSALEGMQKALHSLTSKARLIVHIPESPAKDKTKAFIKWCGFQLSAASDDNHLFIKQ
jgi:FkbM family methyltransferase